MKHKLFILQLLLHAVAIGNSGKTFERQNAKSRSAKKTGYMFSGWSKTLSNPYTFGYIYLPAFLAISIASCIAAPYGVRYSHSLPEAYLKKIFAVISLALSIKMLILFVHF